MVTLITVAGFVFGGSFSISSHHQNSHQTAQLTPAAHPKLLTHPASASLPGHVTLPTIPSGNRPNPSPAPHLPFAVRPPTTNALGPHPASWRSLVPPGAPLPLLQTTDSVAGATPHPGDGGVVEPTRKFCNGLWPSQGNQSVYPYDCYGHDEPGMQFYSNLPGSGGNTTWTMTLPTDRSPTQNQSDLYATFWFGMTLNDPYAWMNQCFLELQFYPDSSWYAPYPNPYNPSFSVNGQWVAQAVAWQIEAATGAENPCFISPLYAHGIFGSNFLNMTQGDQVQIKMTGWPGSPWGENISVIDQTNGNWSTVNLFNRTGAFANEYNIYNNYVTGTPLYPLNPSAVTNTVENSLEWTPGGEYPIVFAFETGHAANPTVPNTNPYGGCSAGPPPPTVLNPAVPCPSYDPGSWLNDTISPLQIGVPTFFNGSTTDVPAQVALNHDLGGIVYIDDVSNGVCAGMEGSAWCSMPWYSYSCGTHTFSFGATDWPGTSEDFGKFFQYPTLLQRNGVGFGFFAPNNFTIPACGGTSHYVNVGTSGPGSAYFLSTWLTGASNPFGMMSPGTYPIHAQPNPGSFFETWQTTGGASVQDAFSPYTALTLSGSGNVTAMFNATTPGATTTVWFNSTTPGAWATVNPGPLRILGPPLTQSALNFSLNLPAGSYGIQALPPPGYNFTGWVLSSGGTVSEPFFPFTQLILNGSASVVTLWATFAPSASFAGVLVEGLGNGTVTFNGTTVPYYSSGEYSFGYLVVPVGSYQLTVTPAPNWAFNRFSYGPSGVFASRYTTTTWVNVEEGFTPIYPIFMANVTFDIGGAGTTLWLETGALIPNNTTVSIIPTWITGATVDLVALPNATNTLLTWLNTANLSTTYTDPFGFGTTVSVSVDGPGTIADLFVNTSYGNEVRFATSPAGAAIYFNGQVYSNGDNISGVANGTYFIDAFGPPGWNFVGWKTFGNVFVAGDEAWVTGTPSAIVAVFQPQLFPVTYVATTPAAAVAWINGTELGSGDTVWLPAGTYSLMAAASTNGTVAVSWDSTFGLSVADSASASTSVDVGGPGTLYAYLEASAGQPSASSAVLDVGQTTTISAPAWSSGSATYAWSGLPAGCSSQNSASLTCTPTASGSFSVAVMVTSSSGGSVTSPALALEVHPLPTVAVSTGTPTVDVGISAVLTVAVSGGTGTSTLSASGLPPGCTWGSGSSSACVPGASGSYNVTVTALDSLGGSGSGTLTLVVNERPTVTGVSVSPDSATLGSAVALSGHVSGGTAPFTYSWSGLPGGCSSANSANSSCAPSAAGTYTVGFMVTDAAGVSSEGFATFVISSTSSPPGGTNSGGTSATNALDLALAAGALILAIVALIVAIVRRPPSGPQPPKPYPSPESPTTAEDSGDSQNRPT